MGLTRAAERAGGKQRKAAGFNITTRLCQLQLNVDVLPIKNAGDTWSGGKHCTPKSLLDRLVFSVAWSMTQQQWYWAPLIIKTHHPSLCDRTGAALTEKYWDLGDSGQERWAERPSLRGKKTNERMVLFHLRCYNKTDILALKRCSLLMCCSQHSEQHRRKSQWCRRSQKQAEGWSTQEEKVELRVFISLLLSWHSLVNITACTNYSVWKKWNLMIEWRPLRVDCWNGEQTKFL